jgi:hypothetical protein
MDKIEIKEREKMEKENKKERKTHVTQLDKNVLLNISFKSFMFHQRIAPSIYTAIARVVSATTKGTPNTNFK